MSEAQASASGAPGAPGEAVREFTVAVFVVHEGAVLLHRHRTLDMWLPPGGHIEPGELPDEAAIRETREESGLDVDLVDTMADLRPAPAGPQRLCRPLGIQLEDIAPGHQHIDLIYVARPRHDRPLSLRSEDGVEGLGWYTLADCRGLGVTAEVSRWAEAALDAEMRLTPQPPLHVGGAGGASPAGDMRCGEDVPGTATLPSPY